MPDRTAGRPPRILFVFEQYSAGGFETHLDTVIGGLALEGVEIYCLGGPDFARSPVRHQVKGYWTADFHEFSGASVESRSREISELVIREQIDFVHAHPFLSFLPAALGALIAGVPFGVSLHGFVDLSLWTTYFGGFFVENLVRMVLPKAAFISCVSDDLCGQLIESLGAAPDKIKVLLNPIDLDRFVSPPVQQDAPQRRGLLISRLDDDKYESCLSALTLFRELQRQDTRWRFRVVGAGNREADLQAFAKKIELLELEWFGRQTNVPALLGQTDLVVGMDRVILEALAAGRIAVLSGYDGLVGAITPGLFAIVRQGNFGGRGMPLASPALVAAEVLERFQTVASDSGVLREMVASFCDARSLSQVWLQVYSEALLLKSDQKMVGQEGLAWLAAAGTKSLKTLEWANAGLAWPSRLLGAPAEGSLMAQALDQRSKALTGEMATLRVELLKAEEVRKRTAEQSREFNAQMDAKLNLYRGQRAWQVMLWVRKAYSLLTGPKKLELLRFAAASVVGRADTSDQELSFPSILTYVPRALMEPLAGTPGLVVPEVSSPGLPVPRKYDVVILAIIDFEFRFQRPQQLATRFAREGHRVFWVSPTRHLPLSSSEPFELQWLDENLWEIQLRGPSSDIYTGTLEPQAADVFLQSLTAVYRRLGIVENCVIAQLPFWRRLALGVRRLFGAKILYDCMDDWDTFPSFGSFNLSEEVLLASETDVLAVTAAKLVEKFSGRGLKPLLVRNGADFEFFEAHRKQPTAALDELPRPIVGYFGAIADWMDLPLVEAVARLRPQYSFVLIGKVFGRDMTNLQKLPNIHLLGHKEYVEIPSYLSSFDVCTIPFLINQVTNATDPVKLYEYFAQGKPVVSTAMAELDYAGDLVYIAHSPTEFAEKLDLALSESTDELSRRRTDFARANSWGHRYQALDGALIRLFPKVSILLVTYNSAEFLAPCLDSILRCTALPNYEILVVDNASRDDTPALINRYQMAESRVQAFCLNENLGFAGGNNFAASKADGEYLVFLNADTIVTSGWLDTLLQHFERDPAMGLLCPVTNFAGNEAKINFDYANLPEMERFAASLRQHHHGESVDLEVVPLFCAVMRREVWTRVGQLDERFGIGMFEDDDFSMRIKAAGLRVAAAEDCFIHHFGQGSFSKLADREYQRIFEQNRALYEDKWRKTWQAHRPRSGVRPASEERRFEPRSFCRIL